MRVWALARGISLAGFLAGTLAAPLAGQATQLDTLLARAGRYVTEFVGRFANVVAEERYLQETLSTSRVRGGSRRELKSDFLLVLRSRL